MTKKQQAQAVAAAVQMASSGQLRIRQRGCGWPVAGGAYLEIDTTKAPIWSFVLDVTYPLYDPASMGLPSAESAIAMVLKERGVPDAQGNPIYDLYDWIGGSAYPNVLDWLLEVQELGFHQKVNPDHLLWLSPESCYFGIHSRAGFMDPSIAYKHHEEVCKVECPKHLDPHPDGTCPRLFYSDVIKGKKKNKKEPAVLREMPSFTWDGFEGLPDIEHVPSIFIRLPIGKIANVLVYEDKDNHTDDEVLKALQEMDQRLQRIKKIPLN